MTQWGVGVEEKDTQFSPFISLWLEKFGRISRLEREKIVISSLISLERARQKRRVGSGARGIRFDENLNLFWYQIEK